jgi:hypothetical protein
MAFCGLSSLLLRREIHRPSGLQTTSGGSFFLHIICGVRQNVFFRWENDRHEWSVCPTKAVSLTKVVAYFGSFIRLSEALI